MMPLSFGAGLQCQIQLSARSRGVRRSGLQAGRRCDPAPVGGPPPPAVRRALRERAGRRGAGRGDVGVQPAGGGRPAQVHGDGGAGILRRECLGIRGHPVQQRLRGRTQVGAGRFGQVIRRRESRSQVVGIVSVVADGRPWKRSPVKFYPNQGGADDLAVTLDQAPGGKDRLGDAGHRQRLARPVRIVMQTIITMAGRIC